MHLIVYISERIGDAKTIDSDLENIVEVSKAANPKHGVTGVLFYHNGTYIQVIEAEKSELKQLMKNIEADQRHMNVRYLVDENVTRRGFGDWNMDSFNLSAKDTLDFETMRRITTAFRKTLLPHSEALVSVYKTFLEEGVFSES